ncbi:erythromycin esterase family protein [Marinifilum fragile]|uniref:erythromycin esterase family protein n=1 Tax=Marinifilum fragile TaxID=570161 RepID=UPI002AA77D05|nr:erythromycin esterase family protein [Marinifilum fragile]
MRRILIFVTVYFCLLITAKSQIKWDDTFTPFVSELLSTEPNWDNNSDLSAIDNLIQDKKIIALGEATHGTREFFTTKHRLIQYLVEEHDFRVFVIEDDYASTHLINEFVAGNSEHSIETLLSRSWMRAWRTQEVRDMLLWMKSFNENRSDSDKVKVFGCDMQWPRSSSIFIRSELKKSNLLDDNTEKTLEYLINYSLRNQMSKREKKEVKHLLAHLNEIALNSSNDRLKFTIRVLEQCMDIMWTSKITASFSGKRDRYMAENCRKIQELEGRKMIVWAHNQHIAEHSDNSKQKPMGAHLKDYFGDNYYTFGFGFYTGEYFAYDLEKKKFRACDLGLPKSDCIDHTFAKAPYKNFILNLKSIGLPEELAALVNNTSWSRRAVGTYVKDINSDINYCKRKLSEGYDALIFIRNTKSVKALPYTP